MARQTVVYDDFSGGEWGAIGGRKAKQNMFGATNMLVYETGELGVRPGMVDRTPSSGLSNGVVHGFGTIGVPTRDAWFIQGTTVRYMNLLAGTFGGNFSGSLAEIPSMPVDIVGATNKTIISSEADKLYYLDTTQATPLVSALTGSPGAMACTIYGDRVMAGDIDGSNEWRLRFSDAANRNSWPAANFIDVGDEWGIKALFPQRQHLVVVKQNTWWVLTGVPGVNPVLRNIANEAGPYHPLHAAQGPRDLIGALPGDLTYPILFDGTNYKAMRYLDDFLTAGRGTGFPASHGVQGLNAESQGLYFAQQSGNRMIAWHNGVWTYHTFDVNISGYMGKFDKGRIAFCDGGGVAQTPKFYVWTPNINTPGFATGDQNRPGDGSNALLTANVSFPEWWTPDGSEVAVRSVIVDFRTWNTGASNTNHFDLKVEAKNLYESTGTRDSNTVSFDQAQASSSTSGTEQRRIFGFGEQGIGSGFQLHFTNVRGIAFKRITVVLDRTPVRTF